MTEPRNRVNWYRVAVIGTAAIVALVALELIALIDYGNPESTAKTISAVIAVVGVVFTGTVSFIGMEVKRSLDERRLSLDREAEERRSFEAERNMQLKEQAEARLRLDSAINAVELFKNATGEGSQAERAGALFALTRLGESDFALHLLDRLWQDGEVDRETALWVINECLEEDSERTQALAATILRSNATKLPSKDGGLSVPSCLLNRWNAHQSEDTIFICVTTVCEALQARPIAEWNRGVLDSLFRSLWGLVEDYVENATPKFRQVAENEGSPSRSCCSP